MVIKKFEDILAWQKARIMVRDIYRICDDTGGKLCKNFRLRDQITAAAVSSMSNIAEGFGRKNDNEFIRFLDYSWGSVSEVQSLLYVILDNEYISQKTFTTLFEQASEVASLIAGFSTYLNNNNINKKK